MRSLYRKALFGLEDVRIFEYKDFWILHALGILRSETLPLLGIYFTIQGLGVGGFHL